MRITKMWDENNMIIATELYITKKNNFFYISVPDRPLRTCPLCEEKHQLTAHHIIPRRMKIKNRALNELRIKICYNCHLEIDATNKYILACKKLSKLLHETTNGEIVNEKEYKEIQKELPYINLDRWKGEEDWNSPKLKLSKIHSSKKRKPRRLVSTDKVLG